MQSVRQFLAATWFQNYAELVVQLGTSIVIARLLTPAEIGVYSIAAVLISFAHTMRQFGVSQYIVQERELTPDKIRAALGVTVALAWSLALLVFLTAEAAADFFREPGVREVMRVMSVALLLVPIGSVPMAHHYRQMNYRVLVRVSLGGTLVTAIVSVALAYHGLGYLALAWGSVAGIAATVLLASLHRPAGFPRWPALRGARKVVAFGGMVTASTLLTELNEGVAELAIGRVQSMESVGLFGKAQGVVGIFHRTVLHGVLEVTFPHFARQVREGDDVAASYLKAAGYVTGVGWPFFAFLALVAYPIIRILYGPQWDASVPIARIMCLGAAIAMALPLVQPIMLAKGSARDHMWLQLKLVAIKIPAVAIAAPHGLAAVATALVLVAPLNLFIVFRALRKQIAITARAMAIALHKSTVVTVATALPTAAVVYALEIGPEHLWGPLLAGAAAAGAGWLAGVFLAGHPLQGELRLLAARFTGHS